MSELKKSLRLERITNADAAKMLERHHPLGSGCKFSFALGIFWNGQCEGVMTFGMPVSNLAVHRYGLRLCDALELRKMWCSTVPPANSESRCLAVAAKIIKTKYPRIQLLITYCDGDERAAAYRAAGWLPQECNTYVREVKVDGKWMTVRDANRYRMTARATEKKTESRRKFVLPLHASVAERFKRSPPRRETAVPPDPDAPFTSAARLESSASSASRE